VTVWGMIKNVKDLLKKKYKVLSIKRKVMSILSVLMLTLSILSFIAMQISFKIYDTQLINNSSETLNLYTTNIENELRKIDKLTFYILSDKQVQSYINIINTKGNSYEKYNAIQAIEKILFNQSETEKYISSITLVDLNGNVYNVGNSVTEYNEETQKEIFKKMEENTGGITWVEPLNGDSNFFAARKIKSLSNMSTIGTLIIRIDPKGLINWISKINPQINTNIVITSETNNIIYKDNKLKLNSNSDVILKGKTNKMYDINNIKYLINYGKSDYTKWNYIYLLPYETIFKNIIIMRSILIFGFFIIFILGGFLEIRFSNGILNQIIMLSKKMKKIQKGDFSIKDLDKVPDEECDELGQLNNNFITMADKIDKLIRENYIKQILIKETQLKALQGQINPHFLYNTLNSINWEAKMNKQYRISTMVNSLGNLLRNSIDNKVDIIKLNEEINLVQDYITIQKIRYEDRLEFKVNIDDEVKECYILKLILQPIVENSIKYGLEYMTGVCEIEISAFKYGNTIELEVRDNGAGVSEEVIEKFKRGEVESKGTGIGLKNIEERIKLFFGEEYGLEIEKRSTRGTVVKIKIPSNI
jgi:two-component system sensor histidine kinase YesM